MLFGIADPLDRVMFKWDDGTPYRLREFVTGASIFGRTGSGKSSGSGLLLARAALGMKGSGGLICASKPGDLAWWRQRFKEARRSNDLIVFGPETDARCNFIDYEMQNGGDTRSITHLLTLTGQSLDDGVSVENEQFWKLSNERMIYNAVEGVRLALGRIENHLLQQFISSAAYTLDQLKDESWRNSSMHFKTMAAAFRRKKSPIEQHDYQLIFDYWNNEFPCWDNRTRSAVIAGVMNIFHTYNTGIVREKVGTTTNVSPDLMDRGKWVIVDYQLDKFGASGKIIMSGWKLLTQKFILRRDNPRNVICIWCDEAQQQVSTFDWEFLSKCRSFMGTMVYLTQSLHSYTSTIKPEKIKALLTNFGTIIGHTIGDPETAKYLSDMLGQYEADKVQISPREDYESPGATMQKLWEPILQPNAFMSGLRSGGKSNKYCVDGIVIRAGEPFCSGGNYIYQVFKQR